MPDDDAPPTETAEDETMARTTARRTGGKRQPLSCLACRGHKLRCDRRVPCGTCIRYNRETQCRQNPAPPHRGKRTKYYATARAETPRPPTVEPSPSSMIAGDAAGEVPRPELVDNGDVEFSTLPRGYQRQLASSCSVTDGLSVLAAFDMELTPWQSLPRLLAQAARGEQSSSAWKAMIDSQFRRRLSQQQLSSVLPSRPQCDLLLNFFLEHVNWIFQAVHEPSFRREYARFWDDGLGQIDFVWSSLLFTIISVSALYVPLEAVDVVGLPREATRNLAHIWYMASLHALRAGEYESRPCLVQLQTFSVTQLYWYATNQVEILNSRLGLAVQTAHALRMDRDTSPSQNLTDELRHRIWWELVDADMFQTDLRPSSAYQQVRDMVSDLGILEAQGCQVPVATHGRLVLRRMLELCESRATARDATTPEEAQSLVPDIANILGGEPTARAYLARLRDHRHAANANIVAVETRRDGEAENSDILAYGANQDRAATWDDINYVGFGPVHSPTQSSHVPLPGAPGGPEGGLMGTNIDTEIIIEDTNWMGLLNWDMTGLLTLDSLDG